MIRPPPSPPPFPTPPLSRSPGSSGHAPPVQAAVLNRLAHVLRVEPRRAGQVGDGAGVPPHPQDRPHHRRSEEHTSELQSRLHLVCRLLLEKKKTQQTQKQQQ